MATDAKKDPEKIKRIISSYHADSRDSDKRIERIERSIKNNSAFSGHFDFTAHVKGQSQEYLPKVTTAVESFAAHIKGGLGRFGEWFRVEMPDDDLFSPENVASILKEYLKNMPDGEDTKSIEQVVSDGAKAGALDSIVIFKVHGERRKKKSPSDVGGRPISPWRLSIDVMPFEDYYPDPTGRKLYEIHEKKVDLFEVVRMAKAGVYDIDEVKNLQGQAAVAHTDAQSSKQDLNRDDTNIKISRSTVMIREFYGTLVDEVGELIGEGMQATVANNTHLIQDAKPISAWCGSPFAVGPLTRVPHTVWHRAVMDHVSDLNQALNELYNLIFDSGSSAVHGVKEVRIGWLEDPGAIAGGIAPQQTIAINDTAPSGASAITVATTGKLPGEVMALYQSLEREMLEASMTNEMRIGSIPQKQVLATEIVSSNQSTAVLLDSVLGEYEAVLSKALTKGWQLIVQNADNLEAGTIIRAVGEERARVFAVMPKEERYRRYVQGSKVVVTGLSSISMQSKELAKLIATIATVRADPVLAQEYMKTIDAAKLFERLFALSGIDLRDIRRGEQLGQPGQQQPGMMPQLQPGMMTPNGEGQNLPSLSPDIAKLLQ